MLLYRRPQQVEQYILEPMEGSDLYKQVSNACREVPEEVRACLLALCTRAFADTTLLPPFVFPPAGPPQHTSGVFLFEGPPGTGKTTTARIIANHTRRPIVLLGPEYLKDMYYGNTEKFMNRILEEVRRCWSGPCAAAAVIGGFGGVLGARNGGSGAVH